MWYRCRCVHGVVAAQLLSTLKQGNWPLPPCLQAKECMARLYARSNLLPTVTGSGKKGAAAMRSTKVRRCDAGWARVQLCNFQFGRAFCAPSCPLSGAAAGQG